MRHLKRADYREMPWANGLGTTIEILRVNGAAGEMLWRFSMATVSENGPFSLFEGIDRNLTVIEGPGFDLLGQTPLRAEFLTPVAFAGDVPVRAANVTGTAVDFNVMTSRALPKPLVQVVRGGPVAGSGGRLCLFALAPSQLGAAALEKYDMLIGAEPAILSGGPAIAITLFTDPV